MTEYGLALLRWYFPPKNGAELTKNFIILTSSPSCQCPTPALSLPQECSPG